MGEACSTDVCDEKSVQQFGRKPEGKKHSEDLGVDGRLI
jgi:hypothetical protein